MVGRQKEEKQEWDRAPRGPNWTPRAQRRIRGGGESEKQLLSHWACEEGGGGGQVAPFKAPSPTSLAAAPTSGLADAAPKVSQAPHQYFAPLHSIYCESLQCPRSGGVKCQTWRHLWSSTWESKMCPFMWTASDVDGCQNLWWTIVTMLLYLHN